MTLSAKIKFTQGSTTAPAGQALIGTNTGSVVCTNDDDTDVTSWRWEILSVPALSDVGPVSPPAWAGPAVYAATTPTFTLAIDGAEDSYCIRLTTGDAGGNVAVDVRAFIVPRANGIVVPPFRAPDSALNVGGDYFEGSTDGVNLRGWAPFVESIANLLERISLAITSEEVSYTFNAPVLRVGVTGDGSGEGYQPSCVEPVNFESPYGGYFLCSGGKLLDEIVNDAVDVVLLGGYSTSYHLGRPALALPAIDGNGQVVPDFYGVEIVPPPIDTDASAGGNMLALVGRARYPLPNDGTPPFSSGDGFIAIGAAVEDPAMPQTTSWASLYLSSSGYLRTGSANDRVLSEPYELRKGLNIGDQMPHGYTAKAGTVVNAAGGDTINLDDLLNNHSMILIVYNTSGDAASTAVTISTTGTQIEDPLSRGSFASSQQLTLNYQRVAYFYDTTNNRMAVAFAF